VRTPQAASTSYGEIADLVFNGAEKNSGKMGATARTTRITYAGKRGKQSVAIVAGWEGTLDDATPGAEALVLFALP